MSPVQGHVACRNLPLTGPHQLLGEDCNAIVFVIVRLISLMKDLVSSLNCRSIRASYVADTIFDQFVTLHEHIIVH